MRTDAQRARKAISNRKYVRKIREKAIAEYGGECACCGEKQYEFLVLDHIHGGGTKQRNQTNRKGHGFVGCLKAQGWPKGELRVLCQNCNASMGLYGYCPHGGLDKEKIV